MLKIIRDLLKKIIDDIDAGNSNIKEVSGPEKYVRGRGMRRDSMGDLIEDKMYDDFYINRHGDT